MEKNLPTLYTGSSEICADPGKDPGLSQSMDQYLSETPAAMEIKPLSALLVPSFTHIGRYWGERTKEWIEGLEERRKKNIDGHLKKAGITDKFFKRDSGPTERQIKLFSEWVKQAEEVDPEEEDDLASLWQGILDEIRKNKPDAEEAIAALQKMSRTDAQILLELPDRKWLRPNEIERSRAEHFRQIGLVAQFSWLHDVREGPNTLGLLAAFLLVSIFAAPTLVGAMPGYEAELVMRLVYASSAFAALFAFLMSIRHLGAYRLTKLGEKLRRSGLKYWSDVRKNTPKSAKQQ